MSEIEKKTPESTDPILAAIAHHKTLDRTFLDLAARLGAAVRQLKEIAEQSGKSFEVVFAAPENRALAARTYTVHHRPTTSSTSGSELQRGG
jgi:hypothetical protein